MLAGRRTLGRMGWNEQYAFAPSELAIAEHYLQMLLGLYDVAGGGQQAQAFFAVFHWFVFEVGCAMSLCPTVVVALP